MKIFFGQIYIEPGVEFPFSHHFQKRLSRELSSYAKCSEKYREQFGADYELMFRISAKNGLSKVEIRGPMVFKKSKDVEYTVFLPYDVIIKHKDWKKPALQYLFHGIYSVLESLEIDTMSIRTHESTLIKDLCSNPMMFKNGDDE